MMSLHLLVLLCGAIAAVAEHANAAVTAEVGAVVDGGGASPSINGIDGLLDPVSMPAFFDNYWEQKPLHVSSSSAFGGRYRYSELDMGTKEMALLLEMQRQASKEALLSLPQSNKSQANCEWVKYGMLDKKHEYHDVYEAYVDGATVVCHLVPAYYRALALLMRELKQDTGFGFTSNLYLSPRQTRGFGHHSDNKNGFIMQVEGEKHWEISGTDFPLPLRHQQAGRPFDRFPNASDVQKNILFDGVIRTGDLLYVPRGFIHIAKSLDSAQSMHFTVSPVKNLEWAPFLQSFFKHFPVQGLDKHVHTIMTAMALIPKETPFSADDAVNAAGSVASMMKDLFHQAVQQESNKKENTFLRASIPPPYRDDRKTYLTRLEPLLNVVLGQLRTVMFATLRPLIEQGAISNVLLEVVFAVLRGSTGQGQDEIVEIGGDGEERKAVSVASYEEAWRKEKAVLGVLSENDVFLDYVDRMNQAGIARPSASELLAQWKATATRTDDYLDLLSKVEDYEIIADGLEVMVKDNDNGEDEARTLVLSWKAGRDRSSSSLRLRYTSVLLKSLQQLVERSQAEAAKEEEGTKEGRRTISLTDFAGNDDFEKYSLARVLHRHSILR